MERPAEELKRLADGAARQIAAADGASAVRVLRMLHGTQAPSPSPESGDGPRGADRVGIWERTSAGGEDVFVRDPDAAHEWNLWASVGRIPPKRAGHRVVFLGELTARGYLYDPAYNPATVLGKILESSLGPGAVEVVDLARTSIETEIGEVALAAAALRPDAVVLFCGTTGVTRTRPTRSAPACWARSSGRAELPASPGARRDRPPAAGRADR